MITEPSPWYAGTDNPWGRPIVPFEMLSVLFQYRAREDRLPVRGPAVGLFADQEIRLLRGPLFVGESYTTEREVVVPRRQPPYREHVGEDDRVRRWRCAGGHDAAQPCEHQAILRTV